ncbi:hypothetical protein [Iamia sp.]|uniref:hypothetical protein n=1 Tax=Iamia sp. TaxID=2722710 RepID=UPI002C917445|nr:hypothetical protein [Iamia sp.]HXH57723.1 hypothetical protein [Iamia sp.]
MTDEVLTVEEIRQRYTRPRKTVSVYLDGSALDEIERLEADLPAVAAADEDTNEANRAPEMARRVEELYERSAASKATFTFEGLAGTAWSDLIRQHPPSEDQRKAGLDHNVDTFPQAAIAASAVAPTLTGDDVDWLWSTLTEGQRSLLWVACHKVNRGLSGPKAQPSRTVSLLASGPRSTTQPPEESPTAPS